ncbi:hypothetical protein GH714_027471 [Hevea brasiliensis]|uniref:Uncharacterized protein n=1 Tax=Hevea brasiliensis TaxID=3981 RepID=A0A6A6MIK2_HEVBR|nr:hypothetical protein GH714_027471 [Hevea brasiliensis]
MKSRDRDDKSELEMGWRENGIRVLSNDTHLESSRGRDPSAALESLMEKPVAMKLLLTSQGRETLEIFRWISYWNQL